MTQEFRLFFPFPFKPRLWDIVFLCLRLQVDRSSYRPVLKIHKLVKNQKNKFRNILRQWKDNVYEYEEIGKDVNVIIYLINQTIRLIFSPFVLVIRFFLSLIPLSLQFWYRHFDFAQFFEGWVIFHFFISWLKKEIFASLFLLQIHVGVSIFLALKTNKIQRSKELWEELYSYELLQSITFVFY